MALYRCIGTRLLEAVWTETKNCFSQAGLGLQSAYSSNGQMKIYARPFKKGENASPPQINIVLLPETWEKGTSGVATTLHHVEADFVFNFDLLNITAGQNSYLDHLVAFRSWLASGGSWPNPTMGIQDPDNLGHEVGHLMSIARHDWDVVPGGIAVPLELTYETREDKLGAIR